MTMVPAKKLSRKTQQISDIVELLVEVEKQHQKGNSSSTSTYGGSSIGGEQKQKSREDQVEEEEEEEEYYYYNCPSLGANINNNNIMSRREAGNINNHDHYCSAESDIVAGPMADDHDESTTNSLNNNETAVSSNSKILDEANNHDHDQAWLRLSIGSVPPEGHLQSKQESSAAPVAGTNMVELDLLHRGGGGSSREETLTKSATTTTPMFEADHHTSEGGIFGSSSNLSLMYFHQYPTGHQSGATSSGNYYYQQQHQEAINNWAAFRPILMPNSSNTASSSSLMMPLLPQNTINPYLPGRSQFQLQPPPIAPTYDFRLVNPPRRPHSGIWFTLQASQNQIKEPFLPQISKSFLRIKDGRMTVRLLMKYLVNKLRLDSESEIEITCRGQQLLPSMTLQHIRDNIWCPTLTSQLQDSSSLTHHHHLMVLHYSRSA